MTIETVKSSIRDVPDFPKKGILFKDLTTAFKRPDILKYIVDKLYEYYKDEGITKVAGIESRGFIVGSALAFKLGAGFVPVRKPGKLPADTFSQTYELEYGYDTVEIHRDALSAKDVVLLHDDLLATGGTALATLELIKMCGVTEIKTNFIVELGFLNGAEKLRVDTEVYSLITF
ncbi:MAG: adenine phosphoribosyltransferase [Bacteroidetes bacterium]|nr:adenine phosphoribosyltransferase [Bacteroidota bacterium]